MLLLHIIIFERNVLLIKYYIEILEDGEKMLKRTYIHFTL